MTRTEAKLQKYQAGEMRRRQKQRDLRLERKRSEVSSFILVFGETLDTLIPFRIFSRICRVIVWRRIRRRLQGVAAADQLPESGSSNGRTPFGPRIRHEERVCGPACRLDFELAAVHEHRIRKPAGMGAYGACGGQPGKWIRRDNRQAVKPRRDQSDPVAPSQDLRASCYRQG